MKAQTDRVMTTFQDAQKVSIVTKKGSGDNKKSQLRIGRSRS